MIDHTVETSRTVIDFILTHLTKEVAVGRVVCCCGCERFCISTSEANALEWCQRIESAEGEWHNCENKPDADLFVVRPTLS